MRATLLLYIAFAVILPVQLAHGQVGALVGAEASDGGTSDPLAMASEQLFGDPSGPLDRAAVDLSTPRRSLQNFIDSARAGDHEKSALSMDFSTLRKDDASFDAANMAWKLKAVLDQTIWITWADIPNEADGTFSSDEDATPRKTISVGKISVRNRQVDITLSQVTREDSGRIWLISDRVVEQIDALYQQHGLGILGEYLPPIVQQYRILEIALWQWIGLLLLVFASYFIGRIIRALAVSITVRLWGRDEEEWSKRMRKLLSKPLTLSISILTYHTLTTAFLGLAEPVREWFVPLMFVLIVLSIAWLVSRLMTILAQWTLEGYGKRLGERDAVRARTLRTQIDVMRRVLNFMIILVAIGIALSQFEIFRTIGTSLLASAGVAGIIIGLAAQRTMSNIFAGIQLALTSPVRIGDSVVFEGEWGWIEEITNTYVVIRIWDLRRLVIPINYLLDHPIQNWTRTSSDLLGTVYIYTDYRCPVGELRKELKRICEESELWDGKVALIQVTNCKEDTLEVRALCSAKDAGTAWDLRCHVREQLVAFLQGLDEGRYLPRTRVELHRLEEEKKEEGEKPKEGDEGVHDSNELSRLMEEEEKRRREREEKEAKDESKEK